MAECGLQDNMMFYLFLLEIILYINLPQFIFLLIRLIEWTRSEEKELRGMIICNDCDSRASMQECQTCSSHFKRFFAKLNSVNRRDITEIIAFIHSIGKTELILHLCQKYSSYDNNTYFFLFEYYVSGSVSLCFPSDHNLHQYISEISPSPIRYQSISLGCLPRPLEPYVTKAMKKRVAGFFSALSLSELKHFALNGIRIPERDFVASVYIASLLTKNSSQFPHNGYLAEVLMFAWEINSSEAQYPLYALEQVESAFQRVGVRTVFDPIDAEAPFNSF